MNEFPHSRMFDSDLREILEMYNTVKGLPSDWEAFRNTMTADWSELKNFVNTFFRELNVQNEINNKIDELVVDGTMDALIRPIFEEYNAEVKLLKARVDNLAKLEEGSTTGDAELADGKVDYTGYEHINIGEHIRQITSQLSSEIGEQKTDLEHLYPLVLDKEYNTIGLQGNKDNGNPTFHGYGIPIKPLKFKKISAWFKAKQTIVDENITIICIVTDNSGTEIARTGTTVLSHNNTVMEYNFVFDNDVNITTEYGYVKFLCANILGYEPTSSTTINTEICTGYETEIRAQVSYDGVTFDDITRSQSYNFSVSFEVFEYTYRKSIPLENREKLDNIPTINEITVNNASELISTIASIATSTDNNKANKNNQYIIYLNAGSYELYPLLDKTGYSDHAKFKRGLEIPDYVSLVGIGNVTISCTIPNSDNTEDFKPTRIISTINTYGENHFKNINFVANNCRYCVHDDDGGSYKDRCISFENCSFKHNGTDEATIWSHSYCYGAGYTGGRKGIFKRCSFEAIFTPFFIHTSSEYYMTDKCFVEIENCAFITANQYALQLDDAYGTDNQGVANISNCYLNGKIQFRGTKGWTIYGGGNSDVEIANENNSKVYIVN